MDSLFSSPADILSIVGAVVAIWVAVTTALKNRTEAEKHARSTYPELIEGAERLIKPLNDRIEELEGALKSAQDERQQILLVLEELLDHLQGAIKELKK